MKYPWQNGETDHRLVSQIRELCRQKTPWSGGRIWMSAASHTWSARCRCTVNVHGSRVGKEEISWLILFVWYLACPLHNHTPINVFWGRWGWLRQYVQAPITLLHYIITEIQSHFQSPSNLSHFMSFYSFVHTRNSGILDAHTHTYPPSTTSKRHHRRANAVGRGACYTRNMAALTTLCNCIY